MVSQRDRNQWITPVFPGKTKPVDSTLCPGEGFLPFRVGLDRGVNRTLGPQRPFLLSSYFGSTRYNTNRSRWTALYALERVFCRLG